ncbi:MAG: hypothetical protein QF815_02505 [Candidatus Peribacteraceae bacterium]|nr:hypothetical protein [Candidatus Peribacteraceae bacterium]
MSKIPFLVGAFGMSIITVVFVALGLDAKPAPADPFNGLHLSAPIPVSDEIAEDDIRLAPFVSYQSDSYGYKIKFPGNWELDDSRIEFDGDILTNPTERVVITISEIKSKELMTEEGVRNLSDSIEESLRFDPAFALNDVQKLIWKHKQTIFSDGIRHVGTDKLRTREYNIFRPNHGGVLNVSITTPEGSHTLYERALQDILHSLDVCPKK